MAIALVRHVIQTSLIPVNMSFYKRYIDLETAAGIITPAGYII